MAEEKSLKKKPAEMEIDLFDIFRKIIVIRKTLYKAAIIGLVFGIIIGVSIPRKYKVNVTLSPEMRGDNSGNGIAGFAASFLGGSASASNNIDALNASLSSDIVSSTPFLLELLHMDIVTNKGEIKQFSNYLLEDESSPWWSYVIGLPGIVIGEVKALFTDDEKLAGEKTQGRIISLTKKEKAQIDALKKKITASIDKKTAITSVSVTLQNPEVAAIVADSVVQRLQEHIIGYRTSKAREDCIYLEKLFGERKQEYYAAQKEYAEYVDTHDNLILQSVRTEQERLQSNMNLAYQVYSQVANQLQVARAKVQEEKPVFAVVEPAVIPLKSSGIGVMMSALLFILVFIFCAAIWVLWGKEAYDNIRKNI